MSDRADDAADADGVAGPEEATVDDLGYSGESSLDAVAVPDDGSAPIATHPEGDGEVHVLGTAHVSHESVDEVEATITERRPDVVAVELDEGRYRQLQGEAPEDLEPSDLLGGNTVFQFLAYWMLSYVQTRLGERFDIQPGADMLAAVETAEKLGLGVALVDRDIQMTVQRFWKRLTFLEKLALVGNLTLAFGSPLAVGIGAGAAFGAVLGLTASMIAAGPLGFAGSDFVAAVGADPVALVGGAVGGAVAGVVLWTFLEPWLADLFDAVPVPNTTASRLGAGVLLGSVGGVAIAASGGAALGPVSVGMDRLTSTGGFVLQTLAGLVGGGVVGAGLGLVVGGVLAGFVPEEEELDELDIEEMTDTDVVSAMMEEFRRFSPGGAEALIDERDAFIAHRLVALREAGYSVVAVVGAGHREGIERYLANPETLPPMESLVGEATGSGLGAYLYKAVGYAITLGFVVFFVLLAIGGASNALLVEIFVAWFVVNAVFAGGLAKLAGARWPSAAVGGGVAWLTSVNPLLAPGWFAGYVELKYNQVSVADISTLNEILDDEEAPIGEIVRRMREVPLFRLILVVAMTNVGSMIASLVVFPVVLTWLSADVGGVGAIGGMLLDGARTGADTVWEAIR